MNTEQIQTEKKAKTVGATQIWVFFQFEGERELTSFKTKPEMDQWLSNQGQSVKILKVLRGVEKKAVVKSKVTFS